MNPLDRATAQTVACAIIADALDRWAQNPGGRIEHGDDYRIADRAVRLHRRGDSIDGLISFHLEGDTHPGPVVAVSVQVSALPLGVAS